LGTDFVSLNTTNIGTTEAMLRTKHPKGTPKTRKKMFARPFVSFVSGMDRQIAVESLSSIVPTEAASANLLLRLSIPLAWSISTKETGKLSEDIVNISVSKICQTQLYFKNGRQHFFTLFSCAKLCF